MNQSHHFSVILHGGAGTLNHQRVIKKVPYLIEAREAAWKKLLAGSTAEEAVVAAIRVMEKSEYFNAGYGGYPNVNGIVLQDIGLMRGNLNFVSLLNIRKIIHPSAVALDLLSEERSLVSVWTQELMEKADNCNAEIKERYGWVANHQDLLSPYVTEMLKENQAEFAGGGTTHGTVGCVVRDGVGNIAAGTCTGGVNTKRNGRIGDSPIIGSGVFADSDICGLSTTGNGESFLQSQISGFVIAGIRDKLRADVEIFQKQPEQLMTILKNEFSELGRKCQGKGGAMILIAKGAKPVFFFNSQMASIAFKSGNSEKIESEDAFIATKEGDYLR